MRCSNCGNEAPAVAKFCLECGYPIADPGAQTQLLDEDEGVLQLRAVQRVLSGEFEVEREVGRGAMAIVYKAFEVSLNRHVALKVLPPSAPVGRAVAERFKREARLAASLDHAHIIPVYRVGQLGATHFISMKFVEGLGLDDILAVQGPLPIPVVLHVLRAATAALAYAHGKGIVHRDVKGANILIDRDGRVLVSDFGIARATEDASLTQTGSVVGTPYYMSPEQCAARRIGPQSDQYSLGVLTFQMLTGLVPFSAETLPGIMHHHFYTPVPDLSKARPDVPPALLAIVNRSLAKKPENRYPTTIGMLKAIEAIPFTVAERTEGEEMLRALARGLPVERVDALPLPALAEPNRLTPRSADVVKRAREQRKVGRVGIAAAALAVAGAGAWGFQGALAEKPAPVVAIDTSAAAPPAARVESIPAAVRPSERTVESRVATPAASAADSQPSAVPTGLVRIRAYPVDADISVNGRSLGRGVVLDAELRAGVHRIRVRAPGYVDFDSTLTIVAGQTAQVRRIELVPSEAPR